MEKEHEEIKNDVISKEQNLQEKEESKFAKIIKRISLAAISLLLLFLVLSYLIPSYNLFSIIASRFSSYQINQNQILLKNNNLIIFENDTYGSLLDIWNQNQQHEFKVCLIGEKDNNIYRINGIQIPKIISQDFSSVRAEPCSKETIIPLHSHPYKSCYLSVHDIKNYKSAKKINKDAFIGIMCEQDRFNFYGFN